MYECKECYLQASKESNGNEELGHLSYEWLHYEWNHLTEEQKIRLYDLPAKSNKAGA